jgi:Ni/Co efflux regulator RcnB
MNSMVAEMRSNPLTDTVRRIGLAASVASVALLALSSPGALAAAPDAHEQNWQQPQTQQQQQHPQQQLQPRQQNNRVNQVQPQPNLKVQPKQQQFQKQQKQIQQNIQPKPAQPPKLQTQQSLQAPQQQKQAQQFPRFDWNTYRPGQRPPQWQQYRANFNPAPYQWNRQAPRVYYIPVYQPPPGWYYRRWAYGQIYPQTYWAQPYWISNYYDYGLQPPPYGYVWVRNGPDAMSVDVVTGLILNVVYGLFGSGGGLL